LKGQIHRRDGARRDLIGVYRRYARDAGVRIADRFLASAEATFQRLAGMPQMGTAYEHEHPALVGLRFLPLSSPFTKFQVFYRPVTDGIEIVRVLHGARDLDRVLAEEFTIGEDTDNDAEEGDNQAEK
jgi:toxin ParE1/3/4